MIKNNQKVTFSGHETFHCRHLWLKKGYDFIEQGGSFSDEDAVVSLGVGKNMVNSIKFWMKAFNLYGADDKVTQLASRLFADEKGWDPYLEDEMTLWVLHHELVKNGYASIYAFIFNELRREKIEFTKANYVTFLRRKSESEKSFIINDNTVNEDFGVMMKMYLRLDSGSKDKEEKNQGLLHELELIKSYSKPKEEFYVIENTERREIPCELLLYALLSNEQYGDSVSLNNIESDFNSAGSIFAINRIGIVNKIEELLPKNPYLVYRDHAGVKELQFKKKPSPYTILNSYYAKS